VSVNNKNPKRKREGRCKTCKCVISTRTVYCESCKVTSFIPEDVLLKDVIYKENHKSSAYAFVRSRARRDAKKYGWNKCRHCPFDAHVEIAHVKAIRDFSEDTPVNVINAKDNLMPLCPNCHWLFDNK
jgi:hypothetical protein